MWPSIYQLALLALLVSSIPTFLQKIVKFATPLLTSRFLYLGIDTHASAGDERIGLSLGRLYLGYYGRKLPAYPTHPHGWHWGILDRNGCLK